MNNTTRFRFASFMRAATPLGFALACLIASLTRPLAAFAMPFESDPGLVLDAATGKPLAGVVIVVGDTTWTYDTAVTYLRSMDGSRSGAGTDRGPAGHQICNNVSTSGEDGIYEIPAYGWNVPLTLMKPGYHNLRLHYPQDFPIPKDCSFPACCGPRNTSRLIPLKKAPRR